MQHDSAKWICIVAGPAYNKSGGLNIIEQDIRGIFGQNFVDIEVVSSDEEKTEPHVFVKCCNYSDHVSALIRSPSIAIVLPSYDNPTYVPESEVLLFKSSVREQKTPIILSVGDKVCVSKGYLESLRGVVVEKCSKHFYKVLFKLHTRKFTEQIPLENLVFEGNVFDNIKIPVSFSGVQSGEWYSKIAPQAQHAYLEIFSGNQIHRPESQLPAATEGCQFSRP